jgi:hypothetical protein
MILWLCKVNGISRHLTGDVFEVWTKKPFIRFIGEGSERVIYVNEDGTARQLCSALYDLDNFLPGLFPAGVKFGCVPVFVDSNNGIFNIKRLTDAELLEQSNKENKNGTESSGSST